MYGWRPLSFPFNHESTKISVYVIISCLDRCILQSFCTFLLQLVVILHLLWSLCVFMVIYIYYSLFLDFFGSYSSLSGIYNRAQKPLSVRALRASQVGSVNVGPYEKSPEWELLPNVLSPQGVATAGSSRCFWFGRKPKRICVPIWTRTSALLFSKRMC